MQATSSVLARAAWSGQYLCNVEGQNAEDVLRPQVPDGCPHGCRSRALVGRGRLSFIALRLCLGRLRAEHTHTLNERLRDLGASAVQPLEQGAADCRHSTQH